MKAQTAPGWDLEGGYSCHGNMLDQQHPQVSGTRPCISRVTAYHAQGKARWLVSQWLPYCGVQGEAPGVRAGGH